MAPHRSAAATDAASAAIRGSGNNDNENGVGNQRQAARSQAAPPTAAATAAAAAAAASSASSTTTLAAHVASSRTKHDGNDTQKISSSPRNGDDAKISASASATTAASTPASRAMQQPPQTATRKTNHASNNNSRSSNANKNHAMTSTTITTTSTSSSHCISAIDFPDTIDPTILSTHGGGGAKRKTIKNSSSSHVATVRDLFPQDADTITPDHPVCIAVEAPLTRNQGTVWMSVHGANAAARHCLPELRRLGVIRRKLLLVAAPTTSTAAAAAAAPSPPPAAAGSNCSNSRNSTSTRGRRANTNNHSAPMSLVQLFQQEQAVDAAKEKSNKSKTPTLKISNNMAQMPKPNGDQLVLESYLRHGEVVPPSTATAAAAAAAWKDHQSRQLLTELASWHGGALIKGPAFHSKRAWFDHHGQLLRLGQNHQVSILSSSRGNNKKKKKAKTSKSSNNETDVAITTTVTQLLHLIRDGRLHMDHDNEPCETTPVRVLQREIPVDTITVLQSLQELAKPEGLYHVPLVVSIPILKQQPHESRAGSTSSSVVELEIAVYGHRLLFECDYANDLLVVMSALDPDTYRVMEPLLPPPAKPDKPVFESDASRIVVESSKKFRKKTSGSSNDDDDDDNLSCCTRDENELSPFSKQGLLKLMESKGSDISEWPAIQAKLAPYFQINLMLHQVHGICWMMQMEAIRQKSPKHGLNALLWEVRQFSDGHGIYYYSPVLGQIRLHLEKSPFHGPRPMSGGLLCDMVGLGKTVQILALVCATAPGREGDDGQEGLVAKRRQEGDDGGGNDHDMKRSKVGIKKGKAKRDDDDEGGGGDDDDYSQYKNHATLVVVTPALVTQWFNEIRKVTGDSLVCEYFDHNTGEFESRSIQQQQCDGVTKKVDIVITTYNAFDMTKASNKRKRGKHPATILKSICWKRVCLDEMQELRSEKSSIAKNIEDVDCDRRWMVSGSPLFEGLGDLRGELAFLRLVPFGANVEDGFWDFAIRQPFENENHLAIELLLSLGQVMLRREKSTRVIETGACILDLQKYSLEFVEVLPTDDERAVYCGLEYLNHNVSEGNQLTMKGKERDHYIRLLRSACTAPALLYPDLKAINSLWTKIHRQTHAALSQSAVLSCLEAIHYLSQIEDTARVDENFVTDQTIGGSRGASIRNRAAVPIGPSREEATEKLAKATVKLNQSKSYRYKALWHSLLEKVTTGQYPFPPSTNTRVSDDEKGQQKNSNEWRLFWTCRGISLFEPMSLVTEVILTRGWRPGRLFYRTESVNPDRDEQIHGLQRRISPLPCSFGHALTNPLSVYITGIPREVVNDDLVGVFDSLSDVIKNHATILPLEPDQNAPCWIAFALFESKNDYDAFNKLARRVDGVELATSTPIPFVEDRIQMARAKVEMAKALLEREKLSAATKELCTAQRGLRIFWKKSPHFREGNVMCTFSEEFLKLRNTTPSTYFEPGMEDVMVEIDKQAKIIREQETILARFKKSDDPAILDASGGSSTFDVLQNLRHALGEDECSICREVFLTMDPGEDRISLTRCGHILCSACYESYHDEDMKNCIICRKTVRLAETRVVDPKKREDLNAADQRRMRPEEQLERVAHELKSTHGRLSRSTWRNLYERFPKPVDASRCANANFPGIPGDFLAHLKNATGIPIVGNKSATVLVENSTQYSSKIRALLKDLPTDERSVVFATSKDIIMLLRKVFDIEGIQHRALYTSQPPKESGRAINEWQTIDSCRVLLVQGGAAACGLTLTAARKMFIVDPFQRHEEEKQAYARIHRIGQTQKVEIKVYYSPVSVEARLLDWRNRAGSQNQDAETITNILHDASINNDEEEDDQIEFLLGRDLSDVNEDDGECDSVSSDSTEYFST